MGAQVLAFPVQEDRQQSRVPFDGRFEYEYDGGEHGTALFRSISEDGACIQIGRYLRPGRQVLVRFHELELNMRVVWCRPIYNGETFVAGVQLLNGGPELALMTLMTIVRRLRAQHGLR